MWVNGNQEAHLERGSGRAGGIVRNSIKGGFMQEATPVCMRAARGRASNGEKYAVDDAVNDFCGCGRISSTKTRAVYIQKRGVG
jgi:hypothetical protein